MWHKHRLKHHEQDGRKPVVAIVSSLRSSLPSSFIPNFKILLKSVKALTALVYQAIISKVLSLIDWK